MGSDKVLGGVFMLIPVVVVIQPLAFRYVSVCDKEYPALSVDAVPDAFEVLLLPSFPVPSIVNLPNDAFLGKLLPMLSSGTNQ